MRGRFPRICRAGRHWSYGIVSDQLDDFIQVVEKLSDPHSVKKRVKFGIAYVKGIMMGLKRIILVEIQCELVSHSYGSEMPGRALILKPDDVGKTTRRPVLVIHGHDRTVEFDGQE